MILPTPADGFEWRDIAGRPALVCRPLLAIAAHVFTTRQWALGSRLPTDSAADGWAEVAEALAVDDRALARVTQVHGAGIAVVRAGVPDGEHADILLGRDAGTALAIRVADCVPILIADRRTGAIAAAHAGWKGLSLRVPQVTVEALRREYASRPEDLVAAAGPSIGACCYEVGMDVRQAFEANGFGGKELEPWFLMEPSDLRANPSMPSLGATRRADRRFFDGWACTRDQLMAAGLARENLFLASSCTASHPGSFCSYRRDGPPAGRLAAAIRMGAAP